MFAAACIITAVCAKGDLDAAPAARGAAPAAQGTGRGTPPAELEKRSLAILEEGLRRWGTPGASAAVIAPGRPPIFVVAGFADREKQVRMQPNTQLPAASISKLFTAAFVMQQTERGRFRIDVPVNSFVPVKYQIRDRDGRPVPATTRQLLSHSSGLPVAWGGLISKGSPVPSLREHLSRGQVALHSPGTHIAYANDGFSLAGFAAAGAEAGDFYAETKRTLLEPLEMRDSTWESPWTLSTGRLAAPYGGLLGGKDRSEHMDVTPTGPAGALISTAPDLANFAQMLLNGGSYRGRRILSSESIDTMWKIVARQDPEVGMGFGLGFAVAEGRGPKRVWWDGGLPGAAGRFLLVPSRGAAVIVLTNMSENATSSETANRIMDLLVPQAPPEYTPKPEELEAFAGGYRFESSVDPKFWFFRYANNVSFEHRDGALWHDTFILKKNRLRPIAPGRFVVVGSMFDGAEVYFKGNRVVIGHVSAVRYPFYSSPTAILIYLSATLLSFVFVIFLGVRGIIRRVRARRALRAG